MADRLPITSNRLIFFGQKSRSRPAAWACAVVAVVYARSRILADADQAMTKWLSLYSRAFVSLTLDSHSNQPPPPEKANTGYPGRAPRFPAGPCPYKCSTEAGGRNVLVRYEISDPPGNAALFWYIVVIVLARDGSQYGGRRSPTKVVADVAGQNWACLVSLKKFISLHKYDNLNWGRSSERVVRMHVCRLVRFFGRCKPEPNYLSFHQSFFSCGIRCKGT